MILISYYYFIINILFYFISFTLTKNSCQKKSYGLNSFVCVCSSKYYFQKRRKLNLPRIEININTSKKYQKIFGFGGAFTDSVGINLNQLSFNTRQKLLEQYFNSENGIGYNIGRVPIASCDFSTHEYSYLDIPNNFSLNNFKLAPEDYELKQHHGWMKTSGRMKGPGQLKGPFNGIYYRTYANYLKKFFEEYSIKNINFWGMTIENEPVAGSIPFYGWQAMYFSSKMQRDFAFNLLSPIFKESNITNKLKIIGHDDQRSGIYKAAKKIYEDLQKIDSIDGLATHWYSRSDYEILNQAHNFQPNKFIISTEACNGYLPWEHKPLLGDWFRGQAYGHDILNNLKNWVIGWIDWNLCLNLQGGPNWVGNFVDSPIIVNASADEFYKQPMFYFLAHFSHFIPRNSLVISSSLFIKKCKNELFKCILNSININLIENQIEHLALITPNGNRILILLNKSQENFDVIVKENNRSWNIPIKSNSIITCIWKENE
ncbi:Glucosylceramidase [Meloidogyne graminicola]|uniref:Glucosylceramidase n=1 Tax=Meloidogyne graminicola TaxID=189291 RepID=A0A8S9ZWN1_9BILA|nr:Glucosylceramidase [Meloidogyne graminicola]